MEEALINCINILDEKDRDIIILYYYTELSLKEISKLFSINENTLKSRHQSIKYKTYKELNKKGLVSEFKIRKPLLRFGGVRNEQR